MRRVSITLEKAETLRVFGREQLRRDSLYLLQETRLWLVDGVLNHQGIGVVHLRSLVVRRPRIALVAPEHAGEWRKAKDLIDLREKMRFDVECRLFARSEDEAEGAAYARAIEPREKLQFARVRCRFAEPKFTE